MLDGHQIVPSGLPADGFRGFPLGVCGVEGDQDRFSCRDFHRVEDGVRLGDLVGAVGDSDLRYRDSLAVKHCGEQRDLVVLVRPGAVHYLPVERDFPLVVPAFPGLREKPRAGYQVQLGRVDPGQHVPYGRFARVLVAEPEPAPFSSQLPQQRLGNVGCVAGDFAVVLRPASIATTQTASTNSRMCCIPCGLRGSVTCEHAQQA